MLDVRLCQKRDTVYLASQGKTFYICMKCRKIDNPKGANLPEEDVEFWSSKQEVKDEINLVDRKLIRGTKAQKIFSSHFDIVNDILNILKENLLDSEGHQDFKNMCRVNQFICNNFLQYWMRDDAQRKMVYREVVDYIPGEIMAEKLGLIEVRCETCKNFRESRNWTKKYYWSKSNTWGDGIHVYCDYTKDSEYFKLYTKQEREAILKKVEAEAQIKLDRKRSFEKCIC